LNEYFDNHHTLYNDSSGEDSSNVAIKTREKATNRVRIFLIHHEKFILFLLFDKSYDTVTNLIFKRKKLGEICLIIIMRKMLLLKISINQIVE
jgi:hypothetical protein